jgi:hypothetical protein
VLSLRDHVTKEDKTSYNTIRVGIGRQRADPLFRRDREGQQPYLKWLKQVVSVYNYQISLKIITIFGDDFVSQSLYINTCVLILKLIENGIVREFVVKDCD